MLWHRNSVRPRFEGTDLLKQLFLKSPEGKQRSYVDIERMMSRGRLVWVIVVGAQHALVATPARKEFALLHE
ncbi:hypothetical protein D3C86_1913860 [compost metagenome]